ncbi:serine/threonine-protein kinase [Nocardiopsis sp. N85]|uniref:serine/threonine protein kinase n=1 Tax=Nocardiopsis sp. N85 TaxID=3029400 RepID=UPI00237F689C|nr:serine/threonine-protein kinase [Nocardiopsis sp. N85]MDE3722255.1 serine/threonine-protein kinase [Nocardiopsis sp. N85]
MTTPLLPTDPAQIGPHTVVSRIDSGGQGTVYLAHTPDGTPTAVKVLSHAWDGDTRQRDRFAQELAAARRVAPFCTAAIIDADMDAEPPYIASEYVPGPTLRSAVQDDGPRTGPDLDRLAIATITALAAVHEAGVVHRDLKPGNVILGPDGPRVIDFGIARIVDATRQTTSVAGTPAYMSPEQIRGKTLGPASDVFSWAAVMVYAATGRRAFPGETTMGIIDRVLTEPPDLTDVPERLRPLLERCLDKEPDRRPTGMDVLGALLGRGPAPQAPTLLLEQTSTAVVTDTARINAVPVPGLPAPGTAGAAGAVAGLAPYVPDPRREDSGPPDTGPGTGALTTVDPHAGAASEAGGAEGTGARAAGGGTGAPAGDGTDGPWLGAPTSRVPGSGPDGAFPATRVTPYIAPGGAHDRTGGTIPPDGAPPHGGRSVARGGRSRRRRSKAGWVTAGALVVLAALGGVLFWVSGQYAPPPVEPVGSTPSSEDVVEDPATGEEGDEGGGEEEPVDTDDGTGTWTPPDEGTEHTGGGGGEEVDCHTDPHHPDCVPVDPPDCETDPEACWDPDPGEGEGGGEGGGTGEGGGEGTDTTGEGGGGTGTDGTGGE